MTAVTHFKAMVHNKPAPVLFQAIGRASVELKWQLQSVTEM